jgi:hypothetical protein
MRLARIAVRAAAVLRVSAAAAILCSLFAAPAALIPSQTVVENPAKPAAKDAGRALSLSEVWRVSDEGGEFYFKIPSNLRFSDDGTIFLAEAGQLLKFSADGKFLENLYKKGQGPGEIEDFFVYDLYDRQLFIQDINSRRFWRADLDGVFQEHISLSSKDFRSFLGVLPDTFLFVKTTLHPPAEKTGGLMETPETVVSHARDGSYLRDIVTFKRQMFLAPGLARLWDFSIITLSPDRKLLYAFHGRAYLVDVIDIASGATIKRFRRLYPKVPYAERGWEPNFRKKYGAPKIEFEIDIINLHPAGEHLWVETSTNDKTKGKLFDVFDEEGRFVDSFHLGTGRRLLAVMDDHVFCQEKNEDESLALVKDRIDK